MSIDTGRERIDGGRQRRRPVDRLTPAAKPEQTGEVLASSASRESADQNEPRERNEPSGPKENAREGKQGISLLSTWLGRLGGYGLALLLVGGAALLHWALWEVLRPTPFLVFYLAWVAAAAFGGLGPGLLATLVSWWCIEFLFDPTPSHIGLHDTASITRLLVFLAGGLVISVVGEGLRRARIHERRQGRELAATNTALRVSEEKYRFLVENSKDITGTIDLRGKPTFVSANVERMTGYRPDEFIGKTLWDFLVPECHDLVKENLRRHLRGEDVPPYEVLVVGKDGRRIPFEVVTAPVVVDGGNIVGVQGVLRDITERKRAEEALRESEFHLAQAQQIAHLGSWSWDLAEDRLFWSDETYRLYGLQPGESAPRHEDFLGFVHPEDRPRVEQGVRDALARGGPCQLDFRLVQKGGRERYVHCEAQVTLDREGHPVKAEGALQDITERKRAEEAVAESRRRYRGLVEKINDWVWEIDADGVYTYSSPRARELLGYAPEEIVGRTPFDLMPPAKAQRVWNAFQPIWLERKPLERLENTLVRKDGRLVTVETSGMPVFAEDGAFLGYTGIDRDVTARKRAEEALRSSQSMLQSVMENVPQGIFWKDRHSTYLGCNNVFAQAVGLESPGDIVGKTDYDLPWLPEQTASFREYDRRIMDNDAPEYHIIEQMRAADGKLAWVETNKAPLHDAQGQVIGILGTYEDITERKRAEEALRQEKIFTDRLLNAPLDTVFVFEPVTGRPVRWNKRFAEVSGYDDEEIAGMRAPDDFYDENDLKKAQECMGRILADGQGVVALSLITKQGVHIPFEYVATVVEAEDGKTLLLSIGRDITERKRAEEALRESEERFRIMADGSPNPIWVTNAEGERIFANKQYLEYFGISEQEMEGGEWKPFIHPDDAPTYVNSFMSSLNEHRSFSAEARVRRADGQWRWIESHAEPRLSIEGGFLGFVGITQDITKRKQAEQELRELNATLESRVAQRTAQLQHRAGQLQKLTLELTEAEERERKRLAEILHDDLQQVLAAAKFHVGLLSSRVKNDAESQEIAEQAKDLLGDAIAKSRSLSHELSAPVLSQSNLGEAFEWLAEQMQTKHGFTVHLDMGERIELASEPLRVLLYKAAQELLFNASKHAGVHEAKLRLRQQHGRIQLLVSDAGRGFDPTEPGCNLGFGLLSIRERVEYLGGRMKIRSAVGKGSTFLITVPDAEGSP